MDGVLNMPEGKLPQWWEVKTEADLTEAGKSLRRSAKGKVPSAPYRAWCVLPWPCSCVSPVAVCCRRCNAATF